MRENGNPVDQNGAGAKRQLQKRQLILFLRILEHFTFIPFISVVRKIFGIGEIYQLVGKL